MFSPPLPLFLVSPPFSPSLTLCLASSPPFFFSSFFFFVFCFFIHACHPLRDRKPLSFVRYQTKHNSKSTCKTRSSEVTKSQWCVEEEKERAMSVGWCVTAVDERITSKGKQSIASMVFCSFLSVMQIADPLLLPISISHSLTLLIFFSRMLLLLQTNRPTINFGPFAEPDNLI